MSNCSYQGSNAARAWGTEQITELEKPMIRKFLTTSAVSLALFTAAPAIAQEDDASKEEMSSEALEQIGSMLGGLFQAEPLTTEQETRLPAAQAIVAQVMPDGFYGKMMRDMMDQTMRPMMAMFTAPEFALAARLQVEDGTLENLDEAQQAELMQMLDPVHDQRVDTMITAMTANFSEMFSVLEPPMREGLSKAYAVRFDEAQLADIATFFATPTGGLYASESMALYADPQVMSAMMQSMPAIMGGMADLESSMKAAMAELPPERAYADLSAAERARMAEILGVEESELEEVVAPPKPFGEDSAAGF